MDYDIELHFPVFLSNIKKFISQNLGMLERKGKKIDFLDTKHFILMIIPLNSLIPPNDSNLNHIYFNNKIEPQKSSHIKAAILYLYPSVHIF